MTVHGETASTTSYLQSTNFDVSVVLFTVPLVIGAKKALQDNRQPRRHSVLADCAKAWSSFT